MHFHFSAGKAALDFIPIFVSTFFITILCSNKFTQIYLHAQNKR